jgi:hypothetical protein
MDGTAERGLTANRPRRGVDEANLSPLDRPPAAEGKGAPRPKPVSSNHEPAPEAWRSAADGTSAQMKKSRL